MEYFKHYFNAIYRRNLDFPSFYIVAIAYFFYIFYVNIS